MLELQYDERGLAASVPTKTLAFKAPDPSNCRFAVTARYGI